jgi:fatty-acyl-CoA synthase
MPESLIEFYADHDIVVRQGMGMTETGPTLFLIDEASALEKAGSIGQPATFVDVKIVDAESDVPADVADPVPRGETGEMVVRGPGVAPGYWNRPEAEAEAFDGDWLHTGDVARRDADGYVYLVDRLKNMFISGGENVYPAEVEHVLHDHPAIEEAAVVAVPDEEWGEVGKAVVVTEAGASLTAQAVTDFCRERLAGYKVPTHVAFRDELPRNAAGKIERAALRES